MSSPKVVPYVFQNGTGEKKASLFKSQIKTFFFLFIPPLFPLFCLPFSHLLNDMFPQLRSTQDSSGRAWQPWEQMTYNQRTAWKANTRFTERLAIQSLSVALSNLQLRSIGQSLKWNAFCFSVAADRADFCHLLHLLLFSFAFSMCVVLLIPVLRGSVAIQLLCISLLFLFLPWHL